MGERIKEIRKFFNLTQQEFADRIGVKRNTVATYEMGRSAPSDSALSLICREFNINEKWLRTGNGKMLNPDSKSELSALAKKYDLSDNAYVLVEKFLNLKKEQRNVLIDFIKDVAAGFAEMDSKSNIKAFQTAISSDIDIESEVESYRRALELQKKAMDESSVSNG